MLRQIIVFFLFPLAQSYFPKWLPLPMSEGCCRFFSLSPLGVLFFASCLLQLYMSCCRADEAFFDPHERTFMLLRNTKDKISKCAFCSTQTTFFYSSRCSRIFLPKNLDTRHPAVHMHICIYIYISTQINRFLIYIYKYIY